MKNLQKGFIVPVLLVIIGLLVIGGGVYIYENKKAETPPIVDTGTQQTNNQNQPIPTQQVTIAEHIVAFEEAINKSDFSNASKYFADKVYVVLEGSSCCGEVSTSRAIQELKRIKGLIFTFNQNNAVVKEYMAYIASQYPDRRLIKSSPKLYFDELLIGVESDISQQNKASVGYKISNDKITDLFINVGRVRQ
ncbi:MAG: hypothetical protein NTZ87_02150 [Candidatus Nomurabacteria bacterium]|nr:hypothetical protein [Candidatus Nomurabacteria bacterium]